MPNIFIDYDERVISSDDKGCMTINVSKAPDNGLSYNSDKQIVVTKGSDGLSGSGGTMNLPGNAIEGIIGTGISIIRCNNTVSRKFSASNDIQDCVNIYETVIKKILGRK